MPSSHRPDRLSAMRRDVTARLQLTISEPALMALQIAVAGGATSERLTLKLDDAVLDPPRELDAGHGGRTHVLHCAPGELVVEDVAQGEGRQEIPAAPPSQEVDRPIPPPPRPDCPAGRP